MNEKSVDKVRSGGTKNLSLEQCEELSAKIGERPSQRRMHLKIAVLAVLKYDADGRYLNASQIADYGQNYLAKNNSLSSQVVGSVLGTLARMEIVNRSFNRPHTYWWRE